MGCFTYKNIKFNDEQSLKEYMKNEIQSKIDRNLKTKRNALPHIDSTMIPYEQLVDIDSVIKDSDNPSLAMMNEVNKQLDFELNSLLVTGNAIKPKKINFITYKNFYSNLNLALTSSINGLKRSVKFMDSKDALNTRKRITHLEKVLVDIKSANPKRLKAKKIEDLEDNTLAQIKNIEKMIESKDVHDLDIAFDSLKYLSEFFNISPSADNHGIFSNVANLYDKNGVLNITQEEADTAEKINNAIFQAKAKLEHKMEVVVNESLSNNAKLNKVFGKKNRDIKTYLAAERDIGWIDSFFSNTSSNIFSSDSQLPQIMKAIVRESILKEHAKARVLQEDLDKLQVGVEKVLNTKKFLGIKTTSFDIFRSKDKKGNQTKYIISRYSPEWYDYINDLEYSKVAAKDIKTKNKNILEKAQRIDPSKLGFIQEELNKLHISKYNNKFKSDLESKKYREDLVNFLGEKEVIRLEKKVLSNILDFHKYQMAVGYDKSFDPFSFDKLSSTMEFDEIIPKFNEKDMLDDSFSEIEKSEELYKYWEALERATAYIGGSFSTAEESFNYYELPSMSKNLIENIFTNGIGEIPAFFSSKLSGLISSNLKESKFGDDAKFINKVYNPESNPIARDEKLYMNVALRNYMKNSKHYNDENGKIPVFFYPKNIKSDEFRKFIADIMGVENNLSALEQGAKFNKKGEKYINMEDYINKKATIVAFSNQSNDIPKVMSTVLAQAADFKGRHIAYPILKRMKNEYNNIERSGKKSGMSALMGMSKDDSSVRKNAVERMDSWWNRSIKRTTDLAVYGVYKGLGKPENSWKRTGGIMTSVLTGKVYTGDEKNMRKKMKKLINDIEKEDPMSKDIIILKSKMEEMGSAIAFSSLINTIFSQIIFRSLAYNIGSGFTNRAEGYLSGLLEDGTGRYWTPGNFFAANRFVSSKFLAKTRFNKKRADAHKIFETMMRNYRLIQDASNEAQKNSTRSNYDMSKVHPFHWSINSVELKNQGSNVLAAMMDINITDNKGNSIPIFDGKEFPAFEIDKNGVLSLKEEFDTKKNRADWIVGNSKNFFNFQSKMEDMLINLHGDFSELGGMRIKDKDLGKAFMLFKTWLPKQIFLRFGISQNQIDSEMVGRNKFKGRYRSHTKLSAASLGVMAGLIISGPIGGLIGAAGAIVMANKHGAMTANELVGKASLVNEVVTHLKEMAYATARMATFHMFKGRPTGEYSYDELMQNAIDQRNMRANLTELMMIFSGMMVLTIIRALKFDDDDDEKTEEERMAWTFISNEIGSLMENGVQYVNPEFYVNMVTSGPFIRWLDLAGKVADSVHEAVVKDIHVFTTPAYNGKNKVFVNTAKLLLPGPLRHTKDARIAPWDLNKIPKKFLHHLVDYDIFGDKEHPLTIFLTPKYVKDNVKYKYMRKQMLQALKNEGLDKQEQQKVIKSIMRGYTGPVKQKKKYSKLLKDPKWKAFKKKAHAHYGNKCRECGRTTDLEVNHLYYKPYTDPWNYPLSAVELVCRNHHQEYHDLDHIKKYKKAMATGLDSWIAGNGFKKGANGLWEPINPKKKKTKK